MDKRIKVNGVRLFKLIQGICPVAPIGIQRTAERAVRKIILQIFAPLPLNAAHPFTLSDRFTDEKDRPGIQIIKQRSCFTAVQHRQIFVGAADREAVFQLFGFAPEGGAGRRRGLSAQLGGQFLELPGKAGRIGNQCLHGRADGDGSGSLGAPLRSRVIQGKRVDLVAEKFGPHGRRKAGGVKIQYSAAPGVLPRPIGLGGLLISAGSKNGQHFFHGDFHACFQGDNPALEFLRRNRVLQGCVNAADYGAGIAV